MDRVLLATSQKNIPELLTQAELYGLGLEIQEFSDPYTLANDWSRSLRWHQELLSGFSGDIGIHGAFFDLTSSSLDPDILAVTRRRYSQNLQIAAELDAKYVLFHLNYLGNCKIPNFRPGWHEREVAFWSSFVREAEEVGIPILLENSWENEPSLIGDILSAVNSPYLKACLDIAHVTLHSEYTVEQWISELEPYLFCSHLNNHDGNLDMHWPLSRGMVDYASVIAALRKSAGQPYLCLEMPSWSEMEPSLSFFELPERVIADPPTANLDTRPQSLA